MKKIILLAAATIATVIACVSCNKGNGGATILPAPEKASYAKKMVLKNNPDIESIELTESGRYIVAMKKEAGLVYRRGEYSIVKATEKYNLIGFGTVEIEVEANTIKVEAKDPEEGGKTITVTAEYTEAPSYPSGNDFFTTVSRAWVVEKTDLSVNMDGKSVGVVKKGCDLPAIAKELNSKGMSINEDALAGYVVKEINFTMAKTIEIAFTGKDSFVGNFNMNDQGKFSYKMEGSIGNQILSGEADGTVDNTKEEGKLYVSFNTKVSSAGTTYTGTVMFILVPASN